LEPDVVIAGGEAESAMAGMGAECEAALDDALILRGIPGGGTDGRGGCCCCCDCGCVVVMAGGERLSGGGRGAESKRFS
jgi:hypothetical protein